MKKVKKRVMRKGPQGQRNGSRNVEGEPGVMGHQVEELSEKMESEVQSERWAEAGGSGEASVQSFGLLSGFGRDH